MATSFEGRAFPTTRSTGDANTQLAQAVFVGKDDNGDRVDFTETDTVVMTLTSAATEGTISPGEPLLSKTFSGEALFETSRITADFVFNYTKNRVYTITFSIFAENQAVARTGGIVTNAFTFVEAPKLVGTDSTNPGGSLSVDTSSSDDKLTLKVKNTPFSHASDTDNDVAKVEITAVTVVAEVSEGDDATGTDLTGKEIKRRYVLPNYDTVINTATKTANYDLTSITGRDDATAEEIITFDFTSDSVGLNAAQDNVVALTFSDTENTPLSILNGQKYDLTFIIDTPGGSLTINPSGTQLITADPNPQTITATTATTAEGLGALEMTITDTDFIVDADLTELIVNLYKGDATTPTSTVTFSTADGTETEKKLETLQINRGNSLASDSAPKVNLLFLENGSTSATDMTVSQDTGAAGEKRAVVTLPQSQFAAGDSFKIGIITKNATDNPVTVQNGFEDNGDSKGEFTLTNLRDGVNFTVPTGGQRSLTIPDAVPETTPSNTFAQPTAVSTSTLTFEDPSTQSDGNAELKAILEAKNLEKAFYNGSTKVTNVFDLDTHPEVDFTDLRLDLLVRTVPTNVGSYHSTWHSYTTNLTLVKDNNDDYDLKNGSTSVGTVTMQDNFTRQILKIPNAHISAGAFPNAAQHKLSYVRGGGGTTNVNLLGNSATLKAATANSVEFEVLHVGASLTTIVFSFLGANINYTPTGFVSYTEVGGSAVADATVAVVEKYPKIELDLQNGTPTTEGTHPNTLSFARAVGVNENSDVDMNADGENIDEFNSFDRTLLTSGDNLDKLIMPSGSYATLQATLSNRYGAQTTPLLSNKQNLDLTPGQGTVTAPVMNSAARTAKQVVFTFADTATGSNPDPRVDKNGIYVEFSELTFVFEVYPKNGGDAVEYTITKTANTTADSANRFSDVTRDGDTTTNRTYAITIGDGVATNGDAMEVNTGDILKMKSVFAKNGYGSGSPATTFTYGAVADTETIMIEGVAQLGSKFTETNANRIATEAFTDLTIIERPETKAWPADSQLGPGKLFPAVNTDNVTQINSTQPRYMENDGVNYQVNRFLDTTTSGNNVEEDGVAYTLTVQGFLSTAGGAGAGTDTAVGGEITLQSRVAHVKTSTAVDAGISQSANISNEQTIANTLDAFKAAVAAGSDTNGYAFLRFKLSQTYLEGANHPADVTFDSNKVPIVASRPTMTLRNSLDGTVDNNGEFDNVVRVQEKQRSNLVSATASSRDQMYVELKLSQAQNANRSSISSITVEVVAAQVNSTVALERAESHVYNYADKRSIIAKANKVRCLTTSSGLASSIFADPFSMSKPMLTGNSLSEEIDLETTAGGSTLLTVGTPLANNSNLLEFGGDWKDQTGGNRTIKFGISKKEITSENASTHLLNGKTWENLLNGDAVIISFPLNSHLCGMELFTRAHITSETPTKAHSDNTNTLTNITGMISGAPAFELDSNLSSFATCRKVSGGYSTDGLSNTEINNLAGRVGPLGMKAAVEALKFVESPASSVFFTIEAEDIGTNSILVGENNTFVLGGGASEIRSGEVSAFDANGMSLSKAIAFENTIGAVQVILEDNQTNVPPTLGGRTGYERHDQIQTGLRCGSYQTHKGSSALRETTIHLISVGDGNVGDVVLQQGNNTNDRITIKFGRCQEDTTAGITRIDDLLDFTAGANGFRQIGIASAATGLLTSLTNYNPLLLSDYLLRDLIHTNTTNGGMQIKINSGIRAKVGVNNPNPNNLNNNQHWHNNEEAFALHLTTQLVAINASRNTAKLYSVIQGWGTDHQFNAVEHYPTGDLSTTDSLTLKNGANSYTIANLSNMFIKTVVDENHLKAVVYFQTANGTRVYLTTGSAGNGGVVGPTNYSTSTDASLTTVVDSGDTTADAAAEAAALKFRIITGRENIPGVGAVANSDNSQTTVNMDGGVYLAAVVKDTSNNDTNVILAVHKSNPEVQLIKSDTAIMKNADETRDGLVLSFITGPDNNGDNTRITPDDGDVSEATTAATVTGAIEATATTFADLTTPEKTTVLDAFDFTPTYVRNAADHIEYTNTEDANNQAANNTVAATKIVAGTSLRASGDWKIVSTNNNTVVQVHTKVKSFTDINNTGNVVLGITNNNSVIAQDKNPTQTIFIMERAAENELDATSHSMNYHDTIDGLPTGYSSSDRMANQAVKSLDDAKKTDIVVELDAQSITLGSL